jgi:hypothetical protein
MTQMPEQQNLGPELPPACQSALQAIENDPLNLPDSALEHLSACRPCHEARILWLAQQDFASQTTPAGYFCSLAGRILHKMPPANPRHPMKTPILAAAALMMLVAASTGYWAGHHSGFARSQAMHSSTSEAVLEALLANDENEDYSQDPMSFSDLDIYSQISDLTPEETQEIMESLKRPLADPQPAKIEGD